MKRSKLSWQITALLITSLFFNSVFAQSDSADDKKSYFKAVVNYLSNAVYFGRKDSAVVPYLRAAVGYFNKSGFYIGGGAALLVNPNEPKRIDLVSIDGGYNFSLKNLDAGVYASKFFYSNASFAVESELKGLAGFYAGYNLGPVTVNAGGDILFSTKTDVSLNLGLSHPFETGEDNNKWTFTPTAQLNAGTQYFNQAYYEYRKFTFATTASVNAGGSSNGNGNGKGKGHSNSSNTGSSSGGTTTTIVKSVTFTNNNRFAILDYEFSLPINYDAKKWGLYAVPVIAVPTSAATYAIDNVIQKENLTTSFFIEIGAYIKIFK